MGIQYIREPPLAVSFKYLHASRRSYARSSLLAKQLAQLFRVLGLGEQDLVFLVDVLVDVLLVLVLVLAVDGASSSAALRLLTRHLDAEQGELLGAGVAHLLEETAAGQRRAQPIAVRAAGVPGVAVGVHRSVAKCVRAMPDYLLRPEILSEISILMRKFRWIHIAL